MSFISLHQTWSWPPHNGERKDPLRSNRRKPTSKLMRGIDTASHHSRCLLSQLEPRKGIIGLDRVWLEKKYAAAPSPGLVFLNARTPALGVHRARAFSNHGANGETAVVRLRNARRDGPACVAKEAPGCSLVDERGGCRDRKSGR